MQVRRRITSAAALSAAALSAAVTVLALAAVAPPALAAAATTFTPGEGTGSAWCPGYGGINLGSYRDVYACERKSTAKNAGKTPFDSYAGFQCTELAARFLYTITGRTLFENQEGGNFVSLAAAAYSFRVGSSGSAGVVPAAGDIISMWGGRSKQKPNGGQTEVAIVTKVSTTKSGWSITTLNQGDPSDNATARGFNTITVSAGGKTWSALNGFYGSFEWLKLARSHAGTGGSGSGQGGSGGSGSSAAWSAAEAPLTASVQTGDLLAVGCSSADTCTAVGFSGTAAMLVYRSGSGWKAATVPLPSSSSTSATLTTISCQSASNCVAAGDYHTGGSQQGMLLSGHGASWTATRAPLPASAATHPHVVLSSAACPAVSWCVAVGQYTGSSKSAYGLLLTGHASSWSGSRAPLPADAGSKPAAHLASVACPAAGHCVAVGTYTDQAGNEQGMIVTQSASGWKAIRAALPPSAVTPGATLSAVTCPSLTVCEAAGSFSARQLGMILTGSGTSWKAIATPLPGRTAVSPATSFRQIFCSSVTACVAVGSYFDGSGYQGLLIAGHGPSWTAARAPLPPGAAVSQGQPGADLVSVGCSSPSACVAAGRYTDTAGDARLLLLTWRGSAWAAAKGPLPGNNRTVGSQAQGALGPPALAAVTCPAATTCVAVGTYPAQHPGMEGLVETARF